jgi:zinc transporter
MPNSIPASKTFAKHLRPHGDGDDVVLDAPVSEGFLWAHIHWEDSEGLSWLKDRSGLQLDIVEALLAPDTRPRCTVFKTVNGDGAFINLRGVNLNAGASPEDMISIRIWVEKGRVISVWKRSLRAVADLVEGIERGQGPASPDDLIAKLALRLADRAEPVVATLNETVDRMEEDVLAGHPNRAFRVELAELRRTAIVLRRFMFPQRDALSTLEIEDLEWLTEKGRVRLREATDRIIRLSEELDAIRDRAIVVHDQVVEASGEVMNRSMLVLSVVAAIFLPLGLLTGLLGINVGGIPGEHTSWAFWAVCALLAGTTVFQLWLYKKLRLI